MRCYELKNDTLLEGLPINDGAGLPRIDVAPDGGFFLPFDQSLVRFYENAPKIAPLRQHFACLARDMRTLHPPRKKNDHLALVVMNLEAGQGGDVTLSGCGYEETVIVQDGRVNKLYKPFPPPGVKVLNEYEEPFPWGGDAQRLDLAAVMIPGASFRIARTGALSGVRPCTFLRWTGSEMIDTPTKRGHTQKETEKRVTSTPAMTAH